MASSSWNTVRSPLTPAAGKQSLLPIKRSAMVAATKIKTASVPLQVKCEKGHKSLETRRLAISRRDMMQCLSAEALGLVFLPKPAEARVSRLDMRRKIMEKLEELREKAGLSKPKTENGTKSPKEPPSPKNDNPPTLPLPPLEGKAKPLVEATLNNIPPFH